jgi:hypothetical protein
MSATGPIVLEPAAQQVADAFSKPPFLYEMAPADARKLLEDAQSAPISKLRGSLSPPRRETPGYDSTPTYSPS